MVYNMSGVNTFCRRCLEVDDLSFGLEAKFAYLKYINTVYKSIKTKYNYKAVLFKDAHPFWCMELISLVN